MQVKATRPADVAVLANLLHKFGKPPTLATLVGNNESMFEILKTNLWPEAVPPSMVVKDEAAKRIRAGSILAGFVNQTLKGKKFLDFGCGEGHVTAEAARSGAQSIGYDPTIYGEWSGFSDGKFTDSLEEVASHGPYDIILLYDVADHVTSLEPWVFMKSVANLMSPSTKLYVRYHPITSPHATHTYTTFNKAYAHLLFDENVLVELGANPQTVIRTHPTADLAKAGLRIEQMNRVVTPVDPFFHDEFILSLLTARHFKGKTKEQILNTLSINFVDIVATLA